MAVDPAATWAVACPGEGCVVSRVFLSVSGPDSRQAAGRKKWLEEQVPGLAGEIYFYLDPHTGTPVGERWREALRQASSRCEAVICLVSPHWLDSGECIAEYAQAEYLNKRIFSARIARLTSEEKDPTREWQHFDLLSDGCARSATEVDIGDGSEPVRLATEGLQRLRDGIVRAGIGAEYFRWPPAGDPDRAPYRGWAPLEEADAAVFSAATRRSCAAWTRCAACADLGTRACS
jgi:TIR domain